MNEQDQLLDPARIVTMRRASELCEVSFATVKRRRLDGRLPGAYQDPSNGHGRWVLPICDLVTAGLLDPDRVARVMPLEPEPESGGSAVAGMDTRLEVLRAELGARTDEIAFLRSLVAARMAT